jgi:putative transcriptional regulator
MAGKQKRGGAEVRHSEETGRRARLREAAAAKEGEAGLLTGQLLIAMPAMNTPHFSQAVIYLCAHTPEGAMGIVLNRPLATPSFDDLLEQLDVAPVPPMRRIELCGGPKRGFLALGYAGWGPGQLDQEIQDNAWLSAPASVDLMFDSEHGTKWRRAMAILKVDPILLSDTAGHA